MRDRLYLIRVNLETYIGPLNFTEIRQSYKKMKFGFQDEVAGSNKEWVSFDDLDKMKSHYPELTKFVKNEMLAGWAPKTEIGEGYDDSDGLDKKRSLPAVFLAITIIISIAVGSIYLSRNWLEKQYEIYFEGPNLDLAIDLIKKQDRASVISFYQQHEKKIRQQIAIRKTLTDWLPLLRAYAFYTGGEIAWLRKHILKGKDSPFAPKDCSLNTWKKRWQLSEGTWRDINSGKNILTSDWTKILIWDPYWIKSRKMPPTWLFPRNYYEGCLVISLKALNMIQPNKNNRIFQNIFKSRLVWMIDIINDTQSNKEASMSGLLWSLSCLESSSISTLQNCFNHKDLSKDWLRLLRFRSIRRQLALLSTPSKMDPNELKQLDIMLGQAIEKDFLTRFDYSLENRLYRQILIENGDKIKAIDHFKSRYREFNFYPW